MSYLGISEESGTCAALPLRDSWGWPLTSGRWHEASVENRSGSTQLGKVHRLPEPHLEQVHVGASFGQLPAELFQHRMHPVQAA